MNLYLSHFPAFVVSRPFHACDIFPNPFRQNLLRPMKLGGRRRLADSQHFRDFPMTSSLDGEEVEDHSVTIWKFAYHRMHGLWRHVFDGYSIVIPVRYIRQLCRCHEYILFSIVSQKFKAFIDDDAPPSERKIFMKAS